MANDPHRLQNASPIDGAGPGADAIVLRRRPRPPAGVEIHLVDVDAGASVEALIATATDEERERAARYRSPRDGRRHLARRLHLRRLVAARLDRPAESVRFLYGAHGKPQVADATLGVSLAHSHGLALIVLADGLEVGCDIEAVDPGFCWRELERAHVLAPAEAQALQARSPEAARAGFYELWTFKEAALKCLGVGLSVDADTIAIEHRRAVEVAGRPAAARLCACPLAAPPGFSAALAWRRRATSAPDCAALGRRGAKRHLGSAHAAAAPRWL